MSSKKFIQHIFVLQDQPQSMTDQGVPCHLLWLAKNKQVTPEKDLSLTDQVPNHLKMIWIAKKKQTIRENDLVYVLEQYPSYRKMGIPNPERFDFPHYGFGNFGNNGMGKIEFEADMAHYMIHDRFKNFKISPELEKLSPNQKQNLIFKIDQLGRYLKQDKKSLQIWLECLENLKAKYLTSTCLNLFDSFELKQHEYGSWGSGSSYTYKFNNAIDAMIEQTQKDIQFHEKLE